MNMVMWIIYPLFAWAGMLAYGRDAILQQNFFMIVMVAGVQAALAQSFWKNYLGENRPYPKCAMISFGLGVMAVVTFPLLVAWSLLVDNPFLP